MWILSIKTPDRETHFFLQQRKEMSLSDAEKELKRLLVTYQHRKIL